MNVQSYAEKYLLHKTAKRSLFALIIIIIIIIIIVM